MRSLTVRHSFRHIMLLQEVNLKKNKKLIKIKKCDNKLIFRERKISTVDTHKSLRHKSLRNLKSLRFFRDFCRTINRYDFFRSIF